ncbi:acyltransferase family protein [Gryllotalpicola protaetiae]|uniref:acyltransferase family protein n=1 Tax=Gryllotalpicola protaetiae TaxID=2419771 RepID=UPI0013C3E846|nr:acyltransferase [Gryllotalpicola protaetiae]
MPALDGIRAIAAIFVVLFHLHVGFSRGDSGVDIFFVLSGFLITSILMRGARQGRIDFAKFYWGRALRLLPVYFAVMAVAVAIAVAWHLGGSTLRGALFSFLYVSNWAAGSGEGLGLLTHTWSLSIEEQFYLVWPLALIGIVTVSRGNGRKAAIGVGVLTVLAYLALLACWFGGTSTTFAWNFTPARGMELLVGCSLALVVSEFKGVRLPGAAWHLPDILGLASVAGLIAIANVQPHSEWFEMLVEWPLVAGVTALLILVCLNRDAKVTQRALSLGPLTTVGKMSYGLYLWHFPVFFVIDASIGLEHWSAKLLAMGIVAAIVPLSYRFIEQPFLRLKSSGTPNAVRQRMAAVLGRTGLRHVPTE